MAKTHMALFLDEDFALAVRMACLKHQTTVKAEVVKHLQALLTAWGEPLSVLPQEVDAHG